MTYLSKCLTNNSRYSRQRLGGLFFFIALVLATVQVYSCRYQLTPDAMDYLDIAREIAAGHWSAAANGYWGTLYSVLLSPLFLFHISPARELPLVHCFGLVILVVSFFCFRTFLHSCLDALNRSVAAKVDETHTPIPEPALSALAYALFLWSSLMLVSVTEIGPDMLVSAITYLAAGRLLRLQRDSRLLSFATFGVILGIGYWAKAVMFPVGLMFLGISALKIRQFKAAVVSTVLFSITAAPLIAALSFPRGRLTFSDSGVLNYASYISPGGRVIHWQGLPIGSGTPKYPTRVLRLDPVIYEFNGPVAGTYPPSYDPSYWNEGHRSTFSLRAQMTAIAGDILVTSELLLVTQPSLIAVFLFLLLWSPGGFRDSLVRWWQLLTAAIGITGLYMLVHVEGRYIAACVVLIWFLLFCALRIPADSNSRRIGTLALLGVVAAMMISLTASIAKPWLHGCADSARAHVDVAQQLNLPAGTAVAVIGPGNFSYWAHLAQLRIVAEIMATDEAGFWKLAVPEQAKFFAAFRSTGAQWLIAQPPPILIPKLSASWEAIGSTSYYRYALAGQREQRTAAAEP